jgi:type IV pilus assembly protein PilP
MEQTRKETKPNLAPLPAPLTFTKFSYASRELIDPFNPAKSSSALAKLAGKNLNALRPNTERRREVLEAYPLDTMQMVGAMSKSGVMLALVKAEGILHQVKVGQYVGQNFGKVSAITETEVRLKEIVQDASGEWVERPAKLELQETKK